jgi:hypothetical protein
MANVIGQSTQVTVAGVDGENTNGGPGVNGLSTTGDGVVGTGRRGVVGISGTFQGVYGKSTDNAGVVGESDKLHGVFGTCHNPNGAGVFGTNDQAGGFGVIGVSDSGIGVSGKGGRLAGSFEGDVEVIGNLQVTGDVFLANRDICERFQNVDAGDHEKGTVMVLDASGQLSPCLCEYDQKVIGVIAGGGDLRPAITLGSELDQPAIPIALVGSAFCKVDATAADIDPGDMLTTSSVLGHAMKAAEPTKLVGAVIGKALAPLRGRRGLIPIIIMLR